MKVIVTGAGGQVGRALIESAPADVELVALTRSQLDIGDASAVSAAIDAHSPDVVINAAAYTAVDAAESHASEARRDNAEGPANLARALAARAAARLVHISTDFVFDGRKRSPYLPQDTPSPIGEYGKSKLAGERAVLDALDDRGLVVRTAWVYAALGRNFVRTMLRLMAERGSVRVVADQHGSPTSAASLAEALWVCAARPAASGTLHWTDAGSTTWHGFAAAIAEEAVDAELLDAVPTVIPITTAEFPTPAQRPAYSVLDTGSAIGALGITPREWRSNLRQVLKEIALA